MKRDIYNLEVGVLLAEDNADYNCYNNVYDKYNAYFDENEIAYLKKDYDNAIEYAKNYVKSGVKRTYAILTYQGMYNLSTRDIVSIKEFGYCDNIELDYSSENIEYSIMKNDDGEIIENFVKKEIK